VTRLWFDSEHVQDSFIFSVTLRSVLEPPSLIFSGCRTEKWSWTWSLNSV